MIYFNLPDFGKKPLQLYIKIIELNKAYPDIFYPNTGIDCIFDCPDGCPWMGGGIAYSENGIDFSYMKDVVDILNNEFNIPICLTLSNPTIETLEECYHEQSNRLAEMCENDYNQIMVSSSILEQYLRKYYPKYKINRSIIKGQELLLDFENYNKIVIPQRLNNDFDFLATIPEQNKKQIEFLCNTGCPTNCPNLYSHYIKSGLKQKNGIKFSEDDVPEYCNRNYVFQHLRVLQKDETIIRQDIDNTYARLGFSQFKLSGRRNLITICFNIIDYMVLPIYQRDVLGMLLDKISVYE